MFKIKMFFSKHVGQINFLSKGKKRNFNTIIFLLFINITIAAIGFITKIKIANILGVYNFGVLALSLVIAAYIEVIVRYGTDKTLVRDVTQQDNKVFEITLATLLFKIILFSSCITALIIYLYSQKANDYEAIFLITVGLSLIAFETKGIYDATDNIRRHTVYFTIFKAIYFILIWFCIIINDDYLTIEYVGWAMLISASIYIVANYRWLLKKYCKKTKVGTILKYTFYLFKKNTFVFFASMFALVLITSNQIILQKYCGTEELGVYAIAWQFFWVGNLFILQLSRVGHPILAKKILIAKNKNETAKFILKYMTTMVMVVLPITIPLIFFPNMIIDLFFTEEFSKSSGPLQLIGVYMVMISTGVAFTQYIIISHNDKFYSFTVLFFGLISILVSFSIIPEHKAVGAALSLMISHGCAIIVFIIFVIKDLAGTGKIAINLSK